MSLLHNLDAIVCLNLRFNGPVNTTAVMSNSLTNTWKRERKDRREKKKDRREGTLIMLEFNILQN